MPVGAEVTSAQMRDAGRRRSLSTTFHRRCASALVHPVTLAALALLLIDLVFKAFWPNPWTTGAQRLGVDRFRYAHACVRPLPRDTASTRSPARGVSHRLYRTAASLRRLQHLWELIMGLLTFASGDRPDRRWIRPIPGHPLRLGHRPLGLDTHSRFSRQSAHAPRRADPQHHRPRNGGDGIRPPPNGLVGKLDDDPNPERPVRQRRWWADVAAWSWDEVEAALSLPHSFRGTTGIFERSTTVTTSRGVYAIEERPSARRSSSSWKTGPTRFQDYLDERDGCRYRCAGAGTSSTVRTGNVVAALGVQGVAVGDADGNWTHVTVNRPWASYFSLGGKFRGLYEDPALWLTATALAIAAAAAALALSRARIYRGKNTASAHSSASLPALASCGLLIAWLRRSSPRQSLHPSRLAVIIVLIVTYLPLAIVDRHIVWDRQRVLLRGRSAIAITVLFVPISRRGHHRIGT